MLKFEKVSASNLAYDRPSPKLIAFLKKHYNLTNYTPQNNNFVIFFEYFKNVSNNTYKKTNKYLESS